MNIIKAIRLVGNFPVTQGFWKNFFVATGLIGALALIFLIFLFGMNDWYMWFLLLVFLIVDFLALFIPAK